MAYLDTIHGVQAKGNTRSEMTWRNSIYICKSALKCLFQEYFKDRQPPEGGFTGS